MPETLTVLDGLLKDVYADVVREQVSTYSPVQEMFEKIEDFDFDGRVVREVAIMSFNEGVGAAAEDANLPTAGNFDPQQFQIPIHYLYGSFQMTKQMMESAKKDIGSFRNATRTSMETMVRNLKRLRARTLWGDGNGILALINGTANSTTQTVDSPFGVASTVGGARFLRKNMVIGIWDPTATTLRGVRTIDSVNAAGTQFTVKASEGAISTTDNDIIVRMNTTGGTTVGESGRQEPMGLLGLVDDGTYVATLHGLSRTTFPQLKSRVNANTGQLSLDTIQLNFDIADQQGDANIDCLAGHHAVRRAYVTLLEADRRYTSDALMSPDGGTKVTDRKKYVTFGGVKVVEDKFAPYDMLFGLDKSTFRRYVQVEGEWAEESGSILRQVTGKDTWTALYRLWENYHCCRPNANFVMSGITTSKVFVQSY